jgi:hypothetical protein
MAYKEQRREFRRSLTGRNPPIGGPVMTDVRGWKPVRQDGEDDDEEGEGKGEGEGEGEEE